MHCTNSSTSHTCEDPQPWTTDPERPNNLKFESLGLQFHGSSAFAGIIRNVFTRSECEQMIALTERLGYEEALVNVGYGRQMFMPDIRKGWRCIVDSHMYAEELWQRVKSLIPPLSDLPTTQRRAEAGWVISGLNERLRFLKYTPGDYFKPHQDGSYTTPDKTATSFYTLQLYLNDGFQGGATRFFCDNDVMTDCVPEAGMVLLFEHRLMHEGSLLEAGDKYVIRTDVMATKP
jgi:hypothetical protein